MYENDSAFTTRFSAGIIPAPNLLCNIDTDSGDLTVEVVALASTYPHFVCTDKTSGAGEEVTCRVIGLGTMSVTCVAAGAITAGRQIYTAPSGKVQVLPTSAGTYWYLGFALEDAAANNSLVKCSLGIPQKIIVEAQP